MKVGYVSAGHPVTSCLFHERHKLVFFFFVCSMKKKRQKKTHIPWVRTCFLYSGMHACLSVSHEATAMGGYIGGGLRTCFFFSVEG